MNKELTTHLLTRTVAEIEAAYEYMRAFNPAIQDRVDTAYIGKKLEAAMANLIALDERLGNLNDLLAPKK